MDRLYFYLFFRILVEIEDLVNETWEDSVGRKSMSKVNGKSLGALRQKLRKYIRENLEEDVSKFRENPDAEDDEEEEEVEKEESEEEEKEVCISLNFSLFLASSRF